MIAQIMLVAAATCYCLATEASALPDQACIVEPETTATAGHAMLQVRQQRTEIGSKAPQADQVRVVSALQQSVGLHTCDGTNDIGELAPFNQSGYLDVKETCCNLEMLIFMKRVIANLSMEVCDEGGVMGLLYWFTCEAKEYTGSFETLVEAFQQSQAPAKCFYLAPQGACEPWPAAMAAECEGRGEWDKEYWEHHPCPTTPVTTTQAPTTTEEPTNTEEPTTTEPTTTAEPDSTEEPTTTAVEERTPRRRRRLASTTKPTQTPTTTSTTPPKDKCLAKSVELQLKTATVTVNNLGGSGPDTGKAQELRYSGVGSHQGKSLDLVVRVRNGDYRKNDVRENNGMLCGNLDQGHGTGHVMCKTGGWFGQINLGAGIRPKKGEKVDLTFTVEDSKTKQPVTLPGFYITFFDIDQNKGDGGSAKVREILTAGGYSKAVYDRTNAEADFSESGGKLTAKSMKLGHGCDNPLNPNTLGVVNCEKNNRVDQKKRSVLLVFEDASSADISFETVCNKCPKDGRNFIFSFRSQMCEDC